MDLPQPKTSISLSLKYLPRPTKSCLETFFWLLLRPNNKYVPDMLCVVFHSDLRNYSSLKGAIIITSSKMVFKNTENHVSLSLKKETTDQRPVLQRLVHIRLKSFSEITTRRKTVFQILTLLHVVTPTSQLYLQAIREQNSD